MAADHCVSTVLSLSLNPSPGISRSREGKPVVDLCPSVWCFNPIKQDQELPISAIPNLQGFTITLLSPSPLSTPSFSATSEDFLPNKNDQDLYNSARIGIIPLSKRKTQQVDDPKPNHKTEEYCLHSTITSDEGVAKKRRVENYWIKKRLSLSDVNSSSRLLLAKEDVKKYVLPSMDEERCAACQSREGLRVKMWDLDTFSEHELILKQWKTGSFLLTSNWCMEFAKRRNLQEGDCIGLLWDTDHLGFFFHKFNAHS